MEVPVREAPAAPDRVLPTLNVDGTRRWITPRRVRGRFVRRRRVLAWALIALFTLLPFLRIGGRPAILLDVARREFTVFGQTFLATDTVLLMLLLVGIFLAVFLVTALWGRVWCGWACPQTVYMEFLYRPLERRLRNPLVRYAAFTLASMALAHTFLAYFVGTDRLRQWVTRSPFEHPVAFALMAGTTILMLLDFAWFREQVCLVACPYGRFQSALLDRWSLLIGYAARRGEPRGIARARKGAPGRAWGDCVDCHACAAVCPMGIDVRDGFQMECIHCAQCVDACDEIMDRTGRPHGLIRYGSRADFAGDPRPRFRPRLVFYPLLLVAVWGALAVALALRPAADVTVLRATGSPFTVLPSGEISNQIRIRVANRGGETRRYRIALTDDGLTLVAPDNPITAEAGKTASAVVFVTARRDAIPGGRRDVHFRITDDAEFETVTTYALLGPTDAPPEPRS